MLEYRGAAIRALDMEERMTVCNMSIEAGARAGMIAPDETTYRLPRTAARARRSGAAWERALERWRALPSDAGRALRPRGRRSMARAIEPMITYGTNPGMVMPVGGSIPERRDDPVFDKALAYMGLHAGEPIGNQPVNVVFIGSCTNGRLSDLRSAAQLLRGRKIARGVRACWWCPARSRSRSAAEAEGLDRVFLDAGAEWRESGCSMCLGMNGDTGRRAGEYSVSTSNRNFEGRQGPGARTLLASPLTAAASAVRGRVTDPREFLNG